MGEGTARGAGGPAEGPGLAGRNLFLRAFLPFALAYLTSYLLRSVTAVAAPSIAADLGLGPRALGVLTSAYFLGYAAMQVPAGILVDRFGPRRSNAALFVLAGLGSLLFGSAGQMAPLGLGRLLVGIGTSAGLLAGYKAHALWFPPRHLPLMNGLLMAVGGLGATLATTPAELAIRTVGWRALFALLALVALAAALLLVLLAPEPRRPAGAGAERAASGRALARVLRDPLFWRLAPVAVLCQGTHLAYQTLWAGPFLAEVGGLDPLSVANHLLVLALAMTAGFALTGWAASGLERFAVPPVLTMAGGQVVFLFAQTWLAFGPPVGLLAAVAAFGASGTATVIAFAVLIRHVPPMVGGRATGLLNLFVFIGAFAIQAGVGQVVALAADPGSGHRQALGLLLGLQSLALGWLLAGPGARMASWEKT